MRPKAWYLIFVVCSLTFANCNTEKKNTTQDHEIASEEQVKENAIRESAQEFQDNAMNVAESASVKYSINDRVIAASIDIQLLTDLVEEGINQKRQEQGRTLLKRSDVLKTAAENQNTFQAEIGKLSHYQTEDAFRDVQKRVLHYGGQYRIVGENVQYQGFQTVLEMAYKASSARSMVKQLSN